MNIQRIFLVGLMGSGKSSVGKLLAESLDWVFLDLDHEITVEFGLSIPGIFETLGEQQFRDFESQALGTCENAAEAVIACGGGIVLSEENRRLLSHQFTIWLDVDPEIAAGRVGDDPNRPLLNQERTPREVLEQLSRERRLLYEDVAKVKVNADSDLETTVNAVVRSLPK